MHYRAFAMPVTPFINQQNARDLQAKAVIARRLKAQTPQVADPVPQVAVQIADSYPSQVLTRTRKQLDSVAQQIDAELEKRTPDHRRLKELAQTQTWMAELERKLSMRPEPGRVQHPKASSRNTRQTVAPIAPVTPQQVVCQPEKLENNPPAFDYSAYQVT